MLPQVRRLFNNDTSYASKSKLGPSTNRAGDPDRQDESARHAETLMYIVQVDETDLPTPHRDDRHDLSQNGEQRSKRTTTSFAQRDLYQEDPTLKTALGRRLSISFSNPFRRLNKLLHANDKSIQPFSTPKSNESPLCSSSTKKSSHSVNPLQNELHRLFPLPPPEFLSDSPVSMEEKFVPIRVYGSGLTDGNVDQTCYFDVEAPSAVLERLAIAIDGPSKADITIEMTGIDLYRVHYKCQSSGNYWISLTHDGKHIGSSPYQLHLRGRNTDAPKPSFAATPIPVRIEPMEFYVNTPCLIKVRPQIPCCIFQAFIRAPQGNMNMPIIVHKSAKSDCYEIYFLPTMCGHYWLNVNLNHIPMLDNPCRLVVRQCSSMEIVRTRQELVFRAYTGELSQFFVSKSPYDSTSAIGEFSVSVSGSSNVQLQANESEHGYEFHYNPLRRGEYLIAIKENDQHIQGGPFRCRVEDSLKRSPMKRLKTWIKADSRSNNIGPTRSQIDLDRMQSSMADDASKICVFGMGLYEARKRRKATFKIDASQAGSALLLVGLYSPHGPCERLVIKRASSSSSGIIYDVSYRVRASGEYQLTILYGSNMQHIPGSPYLVLVK